ncbi:MAG: AAA family ATPase [Synechococcaceae cyanobacterium]|nr:AAA family ATPase [Synechococcaceae cyanobacterium]
MRILHWLEISNFKSYGRSGRIPLEHPSVLIGPNNCGKTTALQAIALWALAARTWQQESKDSKAKKRTGKPLNRLTILSVPVPKTRHFWKNLKVSGKDLQITVGMEMEGDVVPVTMIFRHHASDELIYAEPHPSTLNQPEALAKAAQLDVPLLYPMSGISADEPLITRNRIDYHMGRGSTAEVLRNLCLVVHQNSPQDWQEITALMHRLFQVSLTTPTENEGGSLDLFYEQSGADRPLDLSLAGRGFQQMLLILAHLYAHKGSVLLIDEPDAHLEILRQQQIYVLLHTIADRNGCQVLLATHSEVVMQEALDRHLTLILAGHAEDLASTPAIKESLKRFGAAHYVRARETGHVLYLEGSTDLAMLRAYADRLGHPVRHLIADGAHLNVYYLQDNRPEPGQSPEELLDAVEGAFGQKARDHFFALRNILPKLRGMEIIDNDNRGLLESSAGGFRRLPWKRYELENYLVTPDLLMAWVHADGIDLFADQRQAILDGLLLEQIFDHNQADFENYSKANSSTQNTIWRAQTQTKKLSLFAEEFFRRCAAATGTAIALRKGDFYQLISRQPLASIDPEISEKLDAILGLLTLTTPDQGELPALSC